ncbi:MAG: DUF481 domain-containing protein [Verrucomicrobiota bacterium]
MQLKQSNKWAGVVASVVVLGFSHTSVSGAEPTAVEKKNPWDLTLSAGLTITKGNSDTVLGVLQGLAVRKWEKMDLSLGGDFTYGETKQNGVSTKNNELYRGYGQLNRQVSDKLFMYMRVEGMHDGVADVRYRVAFNPGLGYYFVKNDKGFLRAEVGPGYVIEKLGSVSNRYATLRASERGEYKITKTAKVWEYLEVLPQVDRWSNVAYNFEIGIESSISKSFSLRTYLQDSYRTEPAAGRKKNDAKLVAGISYKF